MQFAFQFGSKSEEKYFRAGLRIRLLLKTLLNFFAISIQADKKNPPGGESPVKFLLKGSIILPGETHRMVYVI